MVKHLAIVTLFAVSTVFYIQAQTYCTPSFSSGCTFNNYISSVSVGGMSNTASGCTVSNYTNKVATMDAGDTIPMTVTTAGWDGIAIYVDLNNDGDMTDAGEMLYVKYTANQPPITYNFNITIPASTSPGNHRFRVNCGNGGSVGGGNPCVSAAYGNFHDYTLSVNNNCPSDSNLTVTNITPSSASISWAPRNGIGYEYILDTLASTPTSAGTPTTTTSFSPSNLTNGTHYYFHIRTSCGNGQFSAWGMIDFVACTTPNAQINQSGNVSLCRGDTVLLTVPFDSSYNYTWFRNGTKIPGQNANSIQVITFPAKYHVEVETFPGCMSISDVADVKIYDKPGAPVLTVNGSQLLTAGFFSYQWFLNGTLISGSNGPSHLALSNGSYFVIGTDSNGCSAGSDTVELTTVGLSDVEGQSLLKVFPNPTTNVLNISLETDASWRAKFYNLQGVLLEQRDVVNEQSVQLDLGDYSKGSYFLIVETAGRGMQRLIVLH
ncbi:MAG: GEVED domain-containing protein [Vicingaceae bacterium]